MKLLELLVQEKVQWSAGALWAVQDFDGELKFTETDEPPECPAHSCTGEVWYRNGRKRFHSVYPSVRASDWDTKAVSKREYDAAVAGAPDGRPYYIPIQMWYAELSHVIAAAAAGKVVQYLAADGNWYTNQGTFMHPSKYRIKPEEPKTIKVNGFDVPEPMREAPAWGASYFSARPSAEGYYNGYSWDDLLSENRWLQRGLLHTTVEAAVAHAKAMLGIDPYATEDADDEHA